MSDKLVLIDGHSILNRAFYGVPELTNATGLHTNAIYGFLNIMFKIIDDEKPNYLIVAFDVKAPTFRHKMYDAYKGTRKPMPEELREQVPVIKEVLKAMKVAIAEQPGFEADDLLGTMAKQAEKEGMQVSLVSGDRDLLQIASENIKVRIPKTKGGKTEIEDYYAKDVLEAYEVTPLQFIDLKALMGDTADNIPGVPKIGTKTATELMKEYGSIDNIYQNLDNISKKSVRESLKENRELADLSLKLATICIECELPFSIHEGKLSELYTKETYELFKQLEFKGLLNRFAKEKTEVDIKENFITITKKKQVEEVFLSVAKSHRAGVALFRQKSDAGLSSDESGQFSLFQTTDAEFFCMALTGSEQPVYFISCNEDIHGDFLKQQLISLSKNCEIDIFDAKASYDCFLADGELVMIASDFTSHFFDVSIAAYLLNPLKNDYDPEDIAMEYLHQSYPSYQQLFAKRNVADAYKSNRDEFISYACRNALISLRTAVQCREALEQNEMLSLFTDIEMPLTYVLYEMQQEGIKVKRDVLKEFSLQLSEKIDTLEQSIKADAQCDFNINSPKQLGEVLFEQMHLPGGKKTKTGYSTAADVLEKLSQEYPFVNKILEYRGLTKLKSTYADGLLGYIDSDDRIRSSFNQTITATGRISSTEPNLQNIPIRMEMGRLIRKAFVPKEDCIFMDADYSQIELRILAHMAADQQLIEAYQTAEDIHRITASKVFHTPLNEVTDLQRRNAKAVNFGIVYGISSFGLSQDLSISTKEANAYINEYFETYKGVKEFLVKCVDKAKETGYSVTMYNRRRPIPELKSSNFMQKNFGERVAMNAPIQGTAADIMKIAMIHVRDTLKKEKLQSRILLQVHDELLLEVYLSEEERVQKVLTQEMENAATLAVRLDVDVHCGPTWYEAK